MSESTARIPAATAGILIVNLGTPEAPTAAALRSYLDEFLSDPCVVNLPRLLWWPILHGWILRTRPQKSAEAYARIWMSAGSPLLVHSRALAAALQQELTARLGRNLPLALGMRYGQPSLGAALAELGKVPRIVVLPLFPQYAGATIGSSVTRIKQLTSKTITCVESYAGYAGYIAALAASVREHWQARGRAEKLLISFHGIPQRMVERGDPYAQQCALTAERLAQSLNLPKSEWQLVFQSRFGRARWLQPYTENTLQQLAAAGTKTVDVICPGFAADCLETLEEISLRYAESFRTAGGNELRYIAALNERSDHVHALADLVMAQLEPAIRS